jgi:cell division protein FtsL
MTIGKEEKVFISIAVALVALVGIGLIYEKKKENELKKGK